MRDDAIRRGKLLAQLPKLQDAMLSDPSGLERLLQDVMGKTPLPEQLSDNEDPERWSGLAGRVRTASKVLHGRSIMNAPNNNNHPDLAQKAMHAPPPKPALDPLYLRSLRWQEWAFKDDRPANQVLDGLRDEAVELLEELEGDFACLLRGFKDGDIAAGSLDWQVTRLMRKTLDRWLEKKEKGREGQTNL